MACASAAVILFAFAASPADALGVRNATSSEVKAASIRFHADSNTQSSKAAMEYESEILGATPGKKYQNTEDACKFCYKTWPYAGEDGPKCMTFTSASGQVVHSSQKQDTSDYVIKDRNGCYCDRNTFECHRP